MDVDLIFKIAAVGILVAVLNILLQRSGREEQALMTTITALVVVLMIVVQKISELFALIKVCSASDGAPFSCVGRCHLRAALSAPGGELPAL